MTLRRLVQVGVVGGSAMLWSSPAAAHPMPGVGDFYAGMLHPLIAIESALALVAIGLFVGQQDRGTAIAALVTVPVMLAAGGALAAVVSWPLVGQANMALMILMGCLVAIGRRLPAPVAVTACALSSLACGQFNGAELVDQVDSDRFVAGIGLVGLITTSYASAFLRRLTHPWAMVAVRMIGSWVAAIGILVSSIG